MIRAAIPALSLLLIGGCTSEVDEAISLVDESIRIKTDMEIKDVVSYPGSAVCGVYSAIISYSRPMKENAPFIVLDGVLDREPSARDWQVYCEEDQAAALYELTGIGPFTRESAELIQITRDLTLLSEALNAYQEDNHHFPSEATGLNALVEKPEDIKYGDNYRPGGYIQGVPQDPWGRPYTYSHIQWGRVKGSYEISTRGKSGEPGGQGVNADVTTKELPYLQHIARVLGVD